MDKFFVNEEKFFIGSATSGNSMKKFFLQKYKSTVYRIKLEIRRPLCVKTQVEDEKLNQLFY